MFACLATDVKLPFPFHFCVFLFWSERRQTAWQGPCACTSCSNLGWLRGIHHMLVDHSVHTWLLQVGPASNKSFPNSMHRYRACKCYVTAQQPAKLVLNNAGVPYKSMPRKSSIDRQTASHLSDPRDLLKCYTLSCEGVVETVPTSPRRNKELLQARDFSPACFCMGRYLCLEPKSPVAMRC